MNKPISHTKKQIRLIKGKLRQGEDGGWLIRLDRCVDCRKRFPEPIYSDLKEFRVSPKSKFLPGDKECIVYPIWAFCDECIEKENDEMFEDALGEERI